jgi:hypothetical protein
MKCIISASRRTDIPAFYLQWFINGIVAGGVQVHNPRYRKKINFVDLSPEKVEWIVFWSRDYSKFLRNTGLFDPYKLFFHFTVNSFNRKLEKGHIAPETALQQAEALSLKYGGDHIIWRYDPIVFWEEGKKIISNFNEAQFRYYCRWFSGMGIKNCYFSFVTPYSKFLRRFRSKYPSCSIVQPDRGSMKKILDIMKNYSVKYGIKLFSCCNNNFVDKVISQGSCISGNLLNNLAGTKVVSEAKSATREDCGCTRSIDIGDYVMQPCYFGCIYCYANPVWK